jgi:D-3-phosphoglycerate dehydrogenase
VTVSGTLTGSDQVEKLVEVNGRSFDIRAEGHVVLVEYTDRPGALGRVGTLLGEQDINIEAAQMSQTRDRTSSLILLRVDQPVGEEVLAPIGQALGARTTRWIPFG